MLRALAGLFIRWLEEFAHLQDAGYVTVALVGLRLLIKVFNDQLVPPQWVMVSAIAIIFAWGFSKRVEVQTKVETTEELPQAIAADILSEAELAQSSPEIQDIPVPK
jgi:predicted tellurium resistance membrane protein TerC